MIKVVNIGMEDEPNVVSTIENVTGGFGTDTLTGDARANTLNGGPVTTSLTAATASTSLTAAVAPTSLTATTATICLTAATATICLTAATTTTRLTAAQGRDTLVGNDGDDTYVAVEGGSSGDIVTEATDEGMDTVHYTAPADDESTTDDESEGGVGTADSDQETPLNVEVVRGTPNDDYIDAADGGVTVLGLGGNDMLSGGGLKGAGPVI